ncbi:MAG: chemotaxis protein CheA [Thermoplasmatota archaeon]
MNEEYQEMFMEETKESIETMNENLLALENDPTNLELIEEIYRASHTLKGMAGTMGYEGIQKLSHRMEELFDKIKEEKGKIHESWFDLLFESVDTIEILSEGEEVDHKDLVERLDEVIEGGDVEEKKESKEDATQIPDKVKQILEDLNDEGVTLAVIEVSEEEKLPALRGMEVKQKADMDLELFFPDPEESDPNHNVFYLITKESAEKKDLDKTASIDIQIFKDKASNILDNIDKDLGEKRKEKEEEKKKKKQKKKKKRKTSIQPSDKIKVDLEDIEKVMNLVSELVISKGTLEDLDTSIKSKRLSSVTTRIDRISGELRESVLDMKMTQVKTVFRRFPRMVRDLAKENDKKINFEMEGEEIELDRTVLERITDPLVHLLRNAVDHGIEPIEERKEKDKAPTGTIKLAATQKEENVVIEISDDGRGLDLGKIKEKAIEKGLATEEELEEMSDEEIYMFIFNSHFSTKDQVTKVSGRGVGMEVVKKTMDSLGGEVSVESTIDEGTTFRMTLPPSVAIVQAFLIEIGEGTYAIPLEDVVETTQVRRDELEQIKGNDFLRLRDNYIPLVYLEKHFDDTEIEDKEKLTISVVNKEDKTAGFVIDEVITEKEIVIKPMPKQLQGLGGFMGATILGDGTIAMILDSLHWIDISA